MKQIRIRKEMLFFLPFLILIAKVGYGISEPVLAGNSAIVLVNSILDTVLADTCLEDDFASLAQDYNMEISAPEGISGIQSVVVYTWQNRIVLRVSYMESNSAVAANLLINGQTYKVDGKTSYTNSDMLDFICEKMYSVSVQHSGGDDAENISDIVWETASSTIILEADTNTSFFHDGALWVTMKRIPE